MSRGLLSKRELAKIGKELPDLSGMGDRVIGLSPDFISVNFPAESEIPVAAVCLQDAFRTIDDAIYALGEILAHRVWYLQKRDKPSELTAVFFSRYYADDVALRLYSAGEHLANAITKMLEIKEDALRPYKKNRVSHQVILGKFLVHELPDHPITKAVKKLMDSEDWEKTYKYRNDWVHNKPPIIAGMGLVYERRRRWQLVQGGKVLGIGGGDSPMYTAEDLINFLRCSLFLIAELLDNIANYYLDILRDAGFEFNDNGLSVTL